MATKNILVHHDFGGSNEIKNVKIDVRSSDPGSPEEGALWTNSTTHDLKFFDGTDTIVLTDSTANVYSTITDGSTPASASGADTIKVRAAGTGLSVATTSNDATHGDSILYTLDSATSGNNKVLLTNGSGKIAASTVQEVLALADLSDVSATTGSGSTVVLSSSPTIVTPTIASLANANHTHLNSAGGGTLTAAAVSDFDTQVRTSRLDQMANPTASVSLNSQKITNLSDPTSAQDAATKAYVDAAVVGIDWKPSVRCASTANVNVSNGLENGDSIDGVTLATGDRVLLKDQSTGAENGIYTVVASGAASRSSDANTSAEVTAGMAVFVSEGTTNADTAWTLVTNDSITLDTTALTFTQFSGLGQVIAGAGLTKTGNTIDVVGTSNRIDVSANAIDISTSYVGQASITTLGTITTGVWNGTDIAVADGGTGSSTAAGARSNLGATGKYSALIGDGSSTSIAITQSTHGLATNGQMVAAIYDASSGDQVDTRISINNSNGTVTFAFNAAPSSNAYRVVIIG